MSDIPLSFYDVIDNKVPQFVYENQSQECVSMVRITALGGDVSVIEINESG